jgi:iron complex outermembrane receptor protein
MHEGWCCAALGCGALLSSCVHAQPNDEETLALIYGDQRSVSIATGSRQPIRRAPSIATVVTAEDIAAIGATDLDDALELVPGLHVSHNAIGQQSLPVLRGIYSQFTSQTLVLHNGVPATTLQQGSRGGVWGGYPVEHIARIEVIRGPGSALYGADAYAGVVNAITKSAADVAGTQIGLRGGSFGSADAWLLHGGRLGDADMAVYLRLGHVDGYRRTIEADAQTRNDRLFGSHASLAPGPIRTGHDALDAQLDLQAGRWRLRGNYKGRSNLGSGGGIASALDAQGRGRSERFIGDLSWNAPDLGRDWAAGATASLLYYHQGFPGTLMLFPPGATFPTGSFPQGMQGAPQTWERQLRLSAFATYAGLRRHKLRLGVGHDDLDMYRTHEEKNFGFAPNGLPVPLPAVIDFTDTAPFLRPHRRRVDDVYAQDEWNFAPDWTLTAGLRHDRFSDAGSTTNPRLALVWDAAYDLTLKLLHGTAFRAPSFAEEYSINNPVNKGNPELRPETIATTEAALAWEPRRDLQLNLNVFRYRMRDIIRAVLNPTPGTGSTIQNTGNQHGHGAELELAWQPLRPLRLTGNLAWQHSIDEATGQDAGYAPHRHAFLRADWRLSGRWLSSAQLNHVGDRRRTAGDNRPPVRDYTTLDLTLRATAPAAPGWRLMGTVRNAFNADVREPSLAPGLIPNDLPMAPRTFYLEASYGF